MGRAGGEPSDESERPSPKWPPRLGLPRCGEPAGGCCSKHPHRGLRPEHDLLIRGQDQSLLLRYEVRLGQQGREGEEEAMTGPANADLACPGAARPLHKATLKGWPPHVYDDGWIRRLRTSPFGNRSVSLQDDSVDGGDRKSERELAAEGTVISVLPCWGIPHPLTSRRSRPEVGCNLPMEA